MMKVAIKYGLIGSIITIIPFVILHYTVGAPTAKGSGFLIDGVLLFIFLFFGLKDFRDNYNQKILHFWQGMTIGVVTYLLMALGYGLFVWLFIDWQGDSYISEHISASASQMKATAESYPDTISKEKLAEGLAQLKNVTAFDLGQKAFLGEIFLGLFLTPLISMILRKKP